MHKISNPSAPRVSRYGHKAVRGIAITALLLITMLAVTNVGLVQNAQGLDPHIITGTCHETNGTVLPNANVTIVNSRTSESSNATSNATGVFAFNALNWPLGWLVGDTIAVNTTNCTGTGGSNSTQIRVGTTSTVIDIWIGTQSNVSGVSFYVVDEEGAPVESAYINVKDSSGDIETTQKTGSNGRATTTLNDGLYTLTVSKSGYDDVTETIRVHGTGDYAIRIGALEAVSAWSDFWTILLWLIVAVVCIALVIFLIKKVV